MAAVDQIGQSLLVGAGTISAGSGAGVYIVESRTDSGYDVQFEVLPLIDVKVAVERNTHNVPEFAIQRMIDRWQD